MKCKKAEKLLLKSFDTVLQNNDKEELEKHLKNCVSCQKKRIEYQDILGSLKDEDFPEPKPYFWERLQPRLKEKNKYEPWPLWKHWAIKAIPLSLFIILMLAASIVFFLPPQNEELSQSGILLRNQNPFQGTIPLLEENELENKNMMLIFTAIEENNGTRRYLP